MALGAGSITPRSWGALLTPLSLALLFYVALRRYTQVGEANAETGDNDIARRLQAPTQKVSNVRFVDGNPDGGWISGSITWDPPANTAGISTYAVLIFNNINDVEPVVPHLPGDYMGAWYLCDLENKPHAPVGTNSLTITTLFDERDNFPRRGSVEVQPAGHRRRYVWGHYHPPDRYLAVACLNHQKQAGPRVVIPIYDASPHLPLEHIENVSFADTNDILGVLGGKVSWAPGVEGDFTLTRSYQVYLAKDDVGTDEMKVGDSTVPTFELMLSDQARGNRDFIRVRGVNDNGLSTWAKSVRIFDVGPSVPTHGVSGLSFTDTDNAQGQVAGTITWTPPDDEAPISSYKIFLSDQQGPGGNFVPSSGYQVAVGTNQFDLPTYVIRNDPDYIQVYAANDKGMQSSPAELPIFDVTGT